MADKVEFQGTVVETAENVPSGVDAVVQQGQGLVFRTEGNRFGTLGADGFYHGYVPSTQVRDILLGAGDDVSDEPASAMDLAIERAKDLGSDMVVGSEAPLPTGDVDNQTDAASTFIAAPETTLTPMTADETKAQQKASTSKTTETKQT